MESDVLPIFPLPELVFLPGELLPLHVFEPRYRALIEHCKANDGRMAMATLIDRAEGDPPAVHPWVGCGRIVDLRELADGRSNVLLAFESPARIDEELVVDTPFRQVRLEKSPMVPPDDYPNVRRIRTLALQVFAGLPVLEPRKDVFDLDGGDLVDALAVLFLRQPEQRLAYLSTTNGPDRVAQVEQALATMLGDMWS
jgi:Lon protease-like protein